uniref:Uncharacterized protein n=1 Tax=Physcomitrium patens TaxID=3218 RepID=A0A7I4BTI0_PHYPA
MRVDCANSSVFIWFQVHAKGALQKTYAKQVENEHGHVVIKIGPGLAPYTSEVSSTPHDTPSTPHDTPTPSPQQSSKGPPSTTNDTPSTPSPPLSYEAPPLTPPGTPSSQSPTQRSKGPTSTPPGTPSSQSKAPISTPPDIPFTSIPLSPPPAIPRTPREMSNTEKEKKKKKKKKEKRKKKKKPQPPPPKPRSPCVSECEEEVETKLGGGVTMPSIFAMCHIPASRQGISEPDTYQVSEDRSGVGSSSWRDEDDVPNFPPAVPSSYMRLKGIVRSFGNKIDARNLVEVGPHGWHASSIAPYDLGDTGDTVTVDRAGWHEKEK